MGNRDRLIHERPIIPSNSPAINSDTKSLLHPDGNFILIGDLEMQFNMLLQTSMESKPKRPGIDQPICMLDNSTSTWYYYHYDGLGSVVALSKLNGSGQVQIVESYIYDAFGRTLIQDTAGPDGKWMTPDDPTPLGSSQFGNPFMFTGRAFDPEPASTTSAPACTRPPSAASSSPTPSATPTP